MAELKKRFLDFITKAKMFSPRDPVLLAVSGGVDSMVMLNLFHECALNYGVAHINFQLRGQESDEDESFVQQTAERLKLKFHSIHFDTEEYASGNKISIQMAARELRYEWLEKVRRDNGYHRIAVAHQVDDGIETVLLNTFRGTGIQGLKGIAPVNEKIVRPLLCFQKEELLEYAREKNISFREDSSNLEVDYERNKIRLDVIPAIEKNFPSFRKIFSGNIEKWKDAASLYDDGLKRVRKNLIEHRGDESWISIPKLQHITAHKTVLFEMLKDFGYNSDQSEIIARSLDIKSGKIFLSETHRIIKDRKHLIISPLSSGAVSEVLILENESSVVAGALALQISERKAKEFSIPKDSSVSCLDKKELEFPLVIRKWKKGDYFYPFGMKKKKKKISDYLIDRKIPLPQKENTWVVESGKRIACIIGERIDERFRITPSTELIYMIEKK